MQKPTGDVPTVPVKNELDRQQSTKFRPTGVTGGKHQYPTSGNSQKATSGKSTNSPAAGAPEEQFLGNLRNEITLVFSI